VEEEKTYRRVTNIRISAHFTHLRKFRNFVFATEVTIFSYHNPLMYLRECAPKSAKLTRWALGLQEFMHADSNIFHTCVKVKMDMVRSIGKQSGESVKSVLENGEEEGYGGKDYIVVPVKQRSHRIRHAVTADDAETDRVSIATADRERNCAENYNK